MAPISEQAAIRHLLRRFGLGVSPQDLAAFGSGSYRQAVEKLLEPGPDGYSLTLWDWRNRENDNLNLRQAQYQWYARLLVTRRPLQERMTIFWHHHFATSGEKVTSAFAMTEHIDTLRANALGPFPKLLHAVSKDPAMLFWLDNHLNTKAKPNENFAREVMELFTLGIGHYTEEDVQEAARAFTGWSLAAPRDNGSFAIVRGANIPNRRDLQFLFDRKNHDEGTKSVIGQSGQFNGDDILDLLCRNPQTTRFLVKKIWEWFVYPEPERALVEQLSTSFRKSGLSVSVLLREIMLSPEFRSEKAMRAVVKSPVDLCVGTLRALGAGEMFLKEFNREDDYRKSPKATNPMGFSITASKAMGMELMFPPDVAGWKDGPAWISTATVIERLKWARAIFGGNNVRTFRWPAWPLFESDPRVESAAKVLCELFDYDASPEVFASLVAAGQDASNGPITQRNANEVAARISQLMFGAPDFHLI